MTATSHSIHPAVPTAVQDCYHANKGTQGVASLALDKMSLLAYVVAKNS